MFTRSPGPEPRRPESRPSRPNGAHSVTSTEPRAEGGSSREKSVIGNDLKIIGQGLKIICRGILQIDGEVQGDVQAAEVIVGERGKVTGMVAGEQVVVRGKIAGVVCGKSVVLQASSEIQGDVHHMAFTIEQGAMFEGRSRRAADESALNSVLESKSLEAKGPPSFDAQRVT
jgi:cytoskeletal protein CcmA (bactofilin family)